MTPTEHELPWGRSPDDQAPPEARLPRGAFFCLWRRGIHETDHCISGVRCGGAEVARRLAEDIGWALLDRELMHQAAAIEHVPDAELESLDEQSIGVADRFRLHPPHNRYIHGLKQVVDRAVAQGNVILVGRGTNQLVGNREDAFHLRLVAPRPWRAQRMAELEGWTQEQALARCTEVDRCARAIQPLLLRRGGHATGAL